MAYDPDIFDEDAEALKAARRAELDELRARLRAKAARLVEVIETMGDPETVGDAWRAVRLVRQADTMVIQLYAEPGMILSSATGRGMQPVRMASPATSSRNEAEDEDQTAEQKNDDFNRRVDRMIMGHARSCGFWPNGEVFDSYEAISDDRMTPSLPYVISRAFCGMDRLKQDVIIRMNASTHHQAKASGQWPDGSPFDPEADNPGYYSFIEGDGHKTDDEEYAGGSLPRWVVRKLRPATDPP